MTASDWVAVLGFALTVETTVIAAYIRLINRIAAIEARLAAIEAILGGLHAEAEQLGESGVRVLRRPWQRPIR